MVTSLHLAHRCDGVGVVSERGGECSHVGNVALAKSELAKNKVLALGTISRHQGGGSHAQIEQHLPPPSPG